jgi:AraC-like DNA-binding protein
MGKALVGLQHVLWAAGPHAGGTIVWGDCGAREAEAITAAWDYEARFAVPYDAVVDMSGLTFVEPRGFLVVERDMRRRLPILARRIRRQAIVRPRGMAGAIVAGFYPMLTPSFDWRLFDRAEDAYGWAFGADGSRLVAELDAIVVAEREPAEDLSRLRQAVRESLDETLTLGAIARRVGRSARTLQRSLTQAGTTFRAEIARLRVERARELLEQSELKVESIARAVGLRSPSSFTATFRAMTGTTPSEYRKQRERA